MSDILEKTSDGFFAVDRDWNFTYVNAEGGPVSSRETAMRSWEISLDNVSLDLVARFSRRTFVR